MGTYDDQELSRKDKAREKRASKSKGSWGNKNTFVNLSLGRLEKEEIRNMKFDPFEFMDAWEGWVSTGHRFSSRAYPEEGHILVSLSGVTEECLNKDWTLTARAPTLERACVVLIYKLDVMLQEKWSLELDDMA